MDKFLNFIGLLKKSNQLVSGNFLVEKQLKRGNCNIILFSNDISDNSKKNIIFYAKDRNVEIFELTYTKAQLGSAIGSKEAVCMAVKSLNGAKKIKEMLEKE